MSNLIAARVQMGNSLAFHIIFVVLAMGMPLMLCIAEGLALWRKDPVWMLLARRWSKAVALIFIIGAVSGTVISFELGLLWPTYINYTGAIVGPLFAIEGIFFFVEAIFVGIYLYGWDRLSPRVHWICSFPIWISGIFAALIIVTVNSWMNTPAGFEVQNGKLTGINSFQAIFNAAQPYEVVHMILASFVGIGFGVATVYAIAILRGKRDEYHRKAMLLGLTLGLVSIPLQMIAGDAIARSLETQQPVKLASMEAVYNTSKDVPLHLMGIPNVPQQSWYTNGLVIPDGLSLLVGFSPNTTVEGLNAVPANDRPSDPLIVIIHIAFDLMVLFGTFMMLVAFVFWIIFFVRRGKIPEYGWLLWGIILCGPMAFIAVECGWVVTEEGRQPWVIYNFLRTSDAVTTAPYLNFTFGVFTITYILMSIILIVLLLRLARQPLPKMEWATVTAVNPAEPSTV
ncbi:MAG: cytochrome ubiquinol oxidase subunit I [Chloroflexi bacterium]|nr:MAG: cytochrome ubiquinol oxidase subunit I [Chloroflexota bacterium]